MTNHSLHGRACGNPFFNDGLRNPNFIERDPSELSFWEISQTTRLGFLKFP